MPAMSLPSPSRPPARPLSIDYLPLDRLKADPKNARQHTAKQIRQIANSIEAFGFNVPILDLNVLAGHGRLLACKRLGRSEVPTIRLEHLSEAQRRAFMIADNRLTEIASWDDRLLAEQLRTLANVELEFDIETIGFDMGEIDLRIESLNAKEAGVAEPPIPDVSRPAVSRVGDLWLLGRHRLLCGDAREQATQVELMGTERAAAVFTDPPYNVAIDGHVSGLGKVRHREFVMAAGEMTPEAFTQFLTAALEGMKASSQPGSPAFICMDWRHLTELLAAAGSASLKMLNLCVWTKPNAGMGSLYRSLARTGVRVQTRIRAASQQCPVGRVWPASQQCVGLCCGTRLWPGSRRGTACGSPSHGQTNGDDRRRDPRRDPARRHRPRSVPRQRRDPDGLRADRSAMLRARTRPALLRRHRSDLMPATIPK
jgi:ParB-like chromosome segregation protein Spo0J